MTVVARLSKFISTVTAGSVADTILEQLGGAGKLAAMTGAKNFVRGKHWLKFDIGRNSSKANRVQVIYNSGSDTYDLVLLQYSKAKLEEKTYSTDRRLQVEELRRAFTSRTGLQLSLGRSVASPTNRGGGEIVHPKPVARSAPAPAPKPVAAPAPAKMNKMEKLASELTPAQRAQLKRILDGGNSDKPVAARPPAPVTRRSQNPADNPATNFAALQKLARKIEKLTDVNNHTGAAIELAKFLGEATMLDDLQQIKKRSVGGTAPRDIQTRDRMIVPTLISTVRSRYGDAGFKLIHGVF